jgi:hypothetical protein
MIENLFCAMAATVLSTISDTSTIGAGRNCFFNFIVSPE